MFWHGHGKKHSHPERSGAEGAKESKDVPRMAAFNPHVTNELWLANEPDSETNFLCNCILPQASLTSGILSRRRRLLSALTASCMVAFASCSPSLYIPTAADASPDASLQELNAGRHLYVQTCGNCHALHQPSDFSKEAWTTKLQKMWPKTRLDENEKSLIVKYIMIGRQKANSPPSQEH